MKVLETPRLVLRRLCDDDAAFLVELLNDPAFLRNIGDKGVRTEDDARRYLREGPAASYEEHGFGLYRVERRLDGAVAGICGLLQRDKLPAPDVGFAFLPGFRSQGYATEAASAVVAHAREDLGLERLLAIVSPGNAASIHVLGKLGFVRRDRAHLAGDEVDLYEHDPQAAGGESM